MSSIFSRFADPEFIRGLLDRFRGPSERDRARDAVGGYLQNRFTNPDGELSATWLDVSNALAGGVASLSREMLNNPSRVKDTLVNIAENPSMIQDALESDSFRGGAQGVVDFVNDTPRPPPPQPPPSSRPPVPTLPEFSMAPPDVRPPPQTATNFLDTPHQPQAIDPRLVDPNQFIPPRYTDDPNYQPHYMQGLLGGSQ